MEMKFSGSSGVRMPWGRELVDFALKIGFAIGSEYEDVLIASDFRRSSDALLNIISGAAMSAGAEVYTGGKVPTPTLAFGAREHDVGIMITASHNPPEYNGIKLWNPDGSAFSDSQMEELKSHRIAEWSRVGSFHRENILEEHREALLKEFSSLNLRVAVDCANGAGSVITPFVLRDLGAEVSTLNCHPSGLFPGHPSEPNEKNLEDLRKMVIKGKFQLGVAHDGDADRFIAITPSGRVLSGDEILAVFIKVLGFKKIVAPVDSSMLLDNFAEVIRVRVGDANVSHAMKTLGVEFGGENSGTQIFAKWRYTPDAIYAALKFAEIAQRIDIDELVGSFPKYHTVRRSLRYEDREDVERRIMEILKDYDFESTDGYRVDLGDAWFLIRFSGTEPKVRITVESESEEKAVRILDDLVKRLKK